MGMIIVLNLFSARLISNKLSKSQNSTNSAIYLVNRKTIKVFIKSSETAVRDDLLGKLGTFKSVENSFVSVQSLKPAALPESYHIRFSKFARFSVCRIT